MQKGLVSVIIPTYKRSDFLKRALESVFNQTYNDWEILIIDDNNPQSEFRKDTEEFMREYVNNPKVKYIKHKENLGGALARNTGIKHASGEYIAFLDDDDEFLPTKLEKQVEMFQSSTFKNLGLVYCLSKKVDHNGKLISKSIVKEKGNAIKYHLLRNITPCPSILVRKSVLEEVKGFRKLIMGQEYDLTLRILAKGYEVDFVDEILVVFHIHNEERISTDLKKIEGLKKLYELKEQHFHLLTKKEKSKVINLYYLNVFQTYMMMRKRRNAAKFLIKAIKQDILNIKNYMELLSFLIGYRNVLKLKRVIHKRSSNENSN